MFKLSVHMLHRQKCEECADHQQIRCTVLDISGTLGVLYGTCQKIVREDWNM